MKDQTGKAPELGQQSVLKVSEVAKLMGLNRATVFHAIHQGKLVATASPTEFTTQPESGKLRPATSVIGSNGGWLEQAAATTKKEQGTA